MADDVGRNETLPRTLLGLAAGCHVGDVDSVAATIVASAGSGQGGYVCLCNVHVLVLALRNDDVFSALVSASLRLPDGAPVAWLQRQLGQQEARRVGGPDLMPSVVDKGRAVGLRHFLYGSTTEVLAGVERALVEEYSGVRVVGRHAPPFSSAVPSAEWAVDAILTAEADVVWCALGAPKQEVWMHHVAAQAPKTVFVGVGAAFDFVAAAKPRAPQWMRDSGLEWLHRLGTEPRRLAGRYVRTNSEFIARSSLELARRRLAS